MKKTLRSLSLIAVFCLMAAFVPLLRGSGTTAYADGDFNIEDGVLTRYSGTAEEVVVPDGVTTIGKNAFNSNTTIKKVTLPDSVQVIDDYAFIECRNLISINFPEGLLRIE